MLTLRTSTRNGDGLTGMYRKVVRNVETLNLDKFGEIMDEFIEKTDCSMLIRLPAGSRDAMVEDNIACGSVVQFYFLLTAIETIAKSMFEEMGINDCKDKQEIAESLCVLICKDIAGGDECGR